MADIHNAPPTCAPEQSGCCAMVAKQPVFDRKDNIWGYELLFRSDTSVIGEGGYSDASATSSVIIDGYSLLRAQLRKGQRFLINFSEELLESGVASVLPPDACCIEILETVRPSEKVLRSLMSLRSQGYMLALDDYIGQPELAPFLPLVDIIKVDVLGRSKNEILNIRNSLELYKATLLAEKVEDKSTSEFCHSIGFSLFQGYFFSRAETVKGAKLNPSQLTKTRLLALTLDKNLDLRQVNEVLTADVYLSYRLLKYINSVYFGFATRIVTVQHAILLLGIKKVRQWLFVTALAEMDASPMAQEIVVLSAARAKFMELVSLRHPATARDKDLPSKLFLTGLFSLLENIMHVPFDMIFSSVGLDPQVAEALQYGTGPLGPWYALIIAYDKGDWQNVKRLAGKLGLSDQTLAKAYADAGGWTMSMFMNESSS